MSRIPHCIRTAIVATLLPSVQVAPATAGEPVVVDWRSSSGHVQERSATELQWSDGTLGITARGHVAEMGPDRSAIVGPYLAGVERNAFGANASGLFLYAREEDDTSGTATGGERCCGVSRTGFNAGYYLSGRTDVEAVNFAVFQFDRPVTLNAITVDDVSNFARSAWIAVGNAAPDLGGTLADLLAPYQVVNAPDTKTTDGLLTTAFDPDRTFTTLVLGAAPRYHDVPGLLRDDASVQFHLRSFAVTPVPEPATVALWALGLAAIGARRAGRRRRPS